MTTPVSLARTSKHRIGRSGAPIVVALVTLALLTGCAVWRPGTSSGLAPAAINAPTLPPSPFSPLADRDKDVSAEVNALATDGTTVVAIGSYEGNVTVPLFRWSSDSGATWHEGEFSVMGALQSHVGDSSAGLAAFSGGTWLALGRSGDDVVAWTSKDAKTWDVSRTSGLDEEQFSAITATSTGWLLVGATLGPDGEHYVPCSWTSPDGITWTPTVVSKTPGELVDVTRRGKSLVAVGELPLDVPNRDGLLSSPAAYLSPDEGKTWRQVSVPEPASSDRFVTLLSKVVASSTGFVAAGSFSRDGSYRNFIVSSTDGVTWTPMPSVESNMTDSWVRQLIVVGDRPMILTGDRNAAGSETEIHIFAFDPAKKEWARVDLPEHINQSDARAALGAGSTALVSMTWTDPVRTVAMFRSTTNGDTWDRQDSSAPSSFTPRVSPSGQVITGKTDLVFGDAQGAGVVWDRSGTGYAPPRVVLDPKRPDIAGMAASPASLLMWGVKDGEAWVAASTDAGATWKYSADQTFNKVTTHSWSHIASARWVKDRWIVVGQRTSNGRARASAFTATSPDGITWSPGVPTNSKTLDADGFDQPPVLSDLDGVAQQQRGMAGVAPIGAEAAAVGWITAGDAPRPAWWSSSGQGHQWRLHELPMSGVNQAWAAKIVAVGSRYVVAGWAKPKADSRDWQPCLWTSLDAGKTWTFSADPGWGTSAAAVTMDTYRNEVLTTVQSKDLSSVTLWRLPEGATTWTKQEITLSSQGSGVQSAVFSTAVKGDTLRILIRVSNRLDAVTVVHEVPLK